MKATITTLAALILCGFTAQAQNLTGAEAWDLLTNAPRAEDVEDDGGFVEPHFIEGEYAEGADPVLIEPQEIWQLFRTAGKVEVTCNVSTKRCEEGPYMGSIDIYVDLNGNKEGQSMTVVGDGRELWSNAISSGVRGFRTSTGSYRLKSTNRGRLKKTRNHCSSVVEYGTKKGGVVNLAPMPYAVHFNGGEAFHAGYVTGKPESHGCVRQPKEYARKLYCLLLSENNWSRATVHIYE